MCSSGGCSVFCSYSGVRGCVYVCTQPVLCSCCRHCAVTQGCSMLHVMVVAASRSSCQRRNTTGRTCTSGKTWCLTALASICPADCSFSPLTASSQPASQSTILSLSPPLWSELHVSRADCAVAGLVFPASFQCLDQYITGSVCKWTCSRIWVPFQQPGYSNRLTILPFLTKGIRLIYGSRAASVYDNATVNVWMDFWLEDLLINI